MPIDLDKLRGRVRGAELTRCKGSVVRVAGLTVEAKGPPVGLGALCDIHLADGRAVPAEVVGFHDDLRVLMPLESIEGISPRDVVSSNDAPRRIPVGEGILGRVIDGLGQPIDGMGPLVGEATRSLETAAPQPLSRPRIEQPLAFGLRAFDGLLTCGRGQRLGIFAGSGVGKSTLLAEIARSSDADVNVLVLVGERGREVREFLENALGPEGLARSVVAVATSDTSPIQRVKVAFLGLTIAEYFRDTGKDVLFMMDSLTRLAMAQREIGLAAGEPPTTKGYCPSVFSLLPRITERLGNTDRGSATGVFTVLVESDDMNDPIADAVRSLLDGHVVLSRKLAEAGQYPAVDVLQSVSRLMPSVASEAHQEAARRFRAAYSTYRESEDLISIGALAPGQNPRIDRAVELIDPIRRFLAQPVGQRSTLDETVQALLEISSRWDDSLVGHTGPGGPGALAALRPEARR